MRERESLFNEFIVEVRRREKEDKVLKKEQVCADISLSFTIVSDPCAIGLILKSIEIKSLRSAL